MTIEYQGRLTPPSTSYLSILRLSLPIWISNITVVGGGTIDTMMVGQLGANDLAGVAVGIAITVSVFMGLVGIMQGLSPIAGHHFGAGSYQRIGYEFHQTLILVAMISVLGIGLLCYTPFWMKVTNSTPEVAAVASMYLIISAFGLPAALGGRAYVALNAAVSRPKVTMWISLCMVILKIPFNYLFIYGFGPLPALGGAGCAMSSTFLTWISLVCYWLIWHYDKFYVRMRLPKFSKPDLKAMVGQLKLGIPIGLSSFFEVTSFTFMTIFISRMGATIVSGHQIVANLTSLFYMLPLSFGIATTVLVSQSLGAKSPQSAKTATFRGLKLAGFCAFISCCIIYFYKSSLLSLYSNEAAVISIATSLIGYACFFHFFDALNCVGSFAMRGYRVTVTPMILYGVLLWGVGLGLGSILAFTNFFTAEPLSAKGYWIGITTGLTLSGTTVCILAIYVANTYGKKKLRIP